MRWSPEALVYADCCVFLVLHTKNGVFLRGFWAAWRILLGVMKLLGRVPAGAAATRSTAAAPIVCSPVASGRAGSKANPPFETGHQVTAR